MQGLCTQSASAQSTMTVPRGFALTEGKASFWAIFERAPARAQFLFHGSALPWGSKQQSIKGLRLRPDGASASPFAAHAWDIEIVVSSVGARATPYPNLESYKTNWGTDHKIVLKRRKISFPAVTSFTSPSKFLMTLAFDAPFLAKGKNLCIDMKSFEVKNLTSRWRADAAVAAWTGTPFGNFSTFGKGCPSNFTCFSSLVYPGSGSLKMYAYSRIATVAPALNWVGFSKSNWGPFPLPQTIPGTSCSFYTDMAINVARVTDGTKLGRIDALPVPIPPDPKLAGLQLYFQFAVLDPKFNSVGLRMSAGGSVKIGNGYSVFNVPFLSLYDYGSGTLPFNPNGDIPYFHLPYVPIFEVY